MWTLLGRRAWPLFALLAACGGGDFSSLPGGNGGAGPSGQGVDAVSVGTSGTQEGPSGSMNSGPGPGSGAGGNAPDPCQNVECEPNEYCSQNTGMCAKCADLDQLEFGPPEKLNAVSGGQAGNQRFPRGTHNETEMLFRSGDTETVLYRTADFTQDAGVPLVGLDLGNLARSGPLEAPGGADSTLSDLNFFWDAGPVLAAGQRMLYGGVRSGNGVSSAITLPAPLNTAASSWSFARSSVANRAWWMSDRTGSIELLTVSLDPAASNPPVKVVLTLPDGCERRGGDATPWVNQGGGVMLFRAREHDASCTPISEASDLFAVPLDPDTGQPTGKASALASMPGADETDPSMSLDLCWLYYSTDEGMGEYDVYRARRR